MLTGRNNRERNDNPNSDTDKVPHCASLDVIRLTLKSKCNLTLLHSRSDFITKNVMGSSLYMTNTMQTDREMGRLKI